MLAESKGAAKSPGDVFATAPRASGLAVSLEPRTSDLEPVSTTAEIGFDVGIDVASTLPGIALRSATSLVEFRVATVFGTGRAAVDFATPAA